MLLLRVKAVSKNNCRSVPNAVYDPANPCELRARRFQRAPRREPPRTRLSWTDFVGDRSTELAFEVPSETTIDPYIGVQAFDVGAYGHGICVNGEYRVSIFHLERAGSTESIGSLAPHSVTETIRCG